MSSRKVIFFELNEVPFQIIDDYCQKYPLSHLAQILPKCSQYITYTPDTVLSPWITWSTVHRGVPATQHNIYHFGQNLTAVNQTYPPIWQILASQGITTGVFGSLHTHPLPTNLDGYAFYIPDSFATSSECLPKHLSAFQEFNLAMARRSSRNVSSKFPVKSTLHLLMQIYNLGLRWSTFVDIARHLLIEQLKPWRKNRRRTYQAVLSFDLFFQQLKTSRPDFATFFTNHVASAMHRYWAAAFPSDYNNFGYSQDWITRYSKEIDFTMSKFEQFFTQLIAFVNSHPEYTLWIASSMGQKATTAFPVQTQLHLANITKFMASLGIPANACFQIPAMFPEVGITVKEPWVNQFHQQLSQLRIHEELISFTQKDRNSFALIFGQVNLLQKGVDYAVVAGEKILLKQMGLENIRIEDETNANAYHIPEGSLIIYDPQNYQPNYQRKRISCLEIAPMILRNFTIKIPAYMKDLTNLSKTNNLTNFA
ncbi:hypothetical protein [Nostoc sp. PCC 7107]|uniref:hypothetical protein n=1 Tax=Nostoc sp. PCC 7107 TaxID=317936 RepID=UPI00029F06AC|nr:hypothetical protein [Nostoc sp. PCC 7107]AFY43931.1 hypothetical protein Nos7107_3351 [Nostoc sp. PCC 7107]